MPVLRVVFQNCQAQMGELGSVYVGQDLDGFDYFLPSGNVGDLK